MFWGGFLQIFLNLYIDMISIVGKGILRYADKIDQDISQEEIDGVHKKYME